MIWEGLSRTEAAEKAGLVPKSLYSAFRKSHVKAYYRTELGALRESARAKNLHALEKIVAESANDMAKVAAIKTMEQLSEEEDRRPVGVQALPGLIIQLNLATPPVSAPIIEHDATAPLKR
jgi:hypothetical protein